MRVEGRSSRRSLPRPLRVAVVSAVIILGFWEAPLGAAQGANTPTLPTIVRAEDGEKYIADLQKAVDLLKGQAAKTRAWETAEEQVGARLIEFVGAKDGPRPLKDSQAELEALLRKVRKAKDAQAAASEDAKPDPLALPAIAGSDDADKYSALVQGIADSKEGDRAKLAVWRRAETLVRARMIEVATGEATTDKAAELRNLLGEIRVKENTLEAGSLHLDFFAAAVFSNLYRDPKTEGYFDHSKPFLLMECEQRIGSSGTFGTYGLISFQSADKPAAPSPTPSPSPAPPAAVAAGTTATPDLISSVTGFNFEGGLSTTHPIKHSLVSFTLFAGAGFAGVSDPANSDAADTFHAVAHGGIRFRQIAGTFRGTYTEFSYLRDPRFKSSDRFQALGRIVLSPDLAGSGGKGLGAYIEGAVNVGKGKDEVRITMGVRMDALAILRALVGADSTGGSGDLADSGAGGKAKGGGQDKAEKDTGGS